MCIDVGKARALLSISAKMAIISPLFVSVLFASATTELVLYPFVCYVHSSGFLWENRYSLVDETTSAARLSRFRYGLIEGTEPHLQGLQMRVD